MRMISKIKAYKFEPLTSSASALVVLSSLSILLLGNYAFFSQILRAYPLSVSSAGFLLSLLIILSGTLVLLVLIFWMLLGLRFGLPLLFLITALSAHFTDKYGVIIDVQMIRNTLQTNSAEALDLITLSLCARLAAFVVLPSLLLWQLPIRAQGFLARASQIVVPVFVTLMIMVLAIVPYKTELAVFIREHKPVRYLVNPATTLYSVFRYVQEVQAADDDNSYIQKSTYAQIVEPTPHYELTVVVVGETARADHFSLNGYARITNPLLAQESRLLSYVSVSACGTSTAVSVPCMFSLDPKSRFDLNNSARTENILDLLHKSGVNVLWRDNNSSSKGVAERIPYESFSSPDINPVCDAECRDVGMLEGLQRYIETHPGDVLIVLHQMGSHGPAYYKRYPPEFEKWTPACQTSELSECTQDEIINAYDNTILYTDYFLSKVIDWLKSNDGVYEPVMLYISDHGESLGEDGLYLHGLPYALAPAAQTQVPLILWDGEHSDIDHEKTKTLVTTEQSHDAIARALAEIFEVDTDINLSERSPLIYLLPEDDS